MPDKIYTARILDKIQLPDSIAGIGPQFFRNCEPAGISNYNPDFDLIQIAGTLALDAEDSRQNSVTAFTEAGIYKINNRGQVVVDGFSLPVTDKIDSYGAMGISNTYPGIVAGFVKENNNDKSIAAIWKNEKLSTLGFEGAANAVNDAGQVAGYTVDKNGNRVAFLYSGDPGILSATPNLHVLGTLGGDNSEALSINNSGQVVGWAEDGSGRKRPFLRSPVPERSAQMIDLLAGTPYDNLTGVAYDINDLGFVVGETWDPSKNSSSGFYWSQATGLNILPSLNGRTIPTAINNNNEVVGICVLITFQEGTQTVPVGYTLFGVKWTNWAQLDKLDDITHIQELKALKALQTDRDMNSTIEYAHDINDQGHILSEFDVDNSASILLLSPFQFVQIPGGPVILEPKHF